MGMFTIAVAFGAGYIVGRPDGRAQLGRYLGQARELADRPEAKRIRERGWDLVGEQAATVKRRFDSRGRKNVVAAEVMPDEHDVPSSHATSPAADSSTTGYNGGATVAEDSQAVILGQPATPPAPRPGPRSDGS